LTNRSRPRLVVLSVLVISLVGTLLGRLWYLQVPAAAPYRAAASLNQVRDIVTEAPRGEVVDDKGRPLIDNKTALVITVNRLTLLAQPNDGKAVLKRLGKVLHTSARKLEQRITLCGPGVHDPNCYGGSPYQPIPVSELKPTLAATRQALQIKEMPESFPGIAARSAAVRNYPKPDGALASSILGFAGPISAPELKKLSAAQQKIEANTQVGKTGIEAEYEKYLHGTPGVKQVAVDHIGAVTKVIQNTRPVTGDTVVTNIDAKAQAALEKDLGSAVTAARSAGHTADFAAGVVLNVRTGGVVAMANYPNYQPSLYTKTLTDKHFKALSRAEGKPLIDKTYQNAQAPGSTFKLVSSLGLIHDGTASIDQAYDCPSTFQNRHNFDGENGKGLISFHEALVISCDTFFFKLGNSDYNRDAALVAAHKKPVEGVQAMAHDLGMGELPGIDLPNAVTGHIADRRNQRLDWQQIKGAYCQGAKNPAFSATHRFDDAQFCKFGYIFEPGDQQNEDLGQGTVTVSPLQLAVAYGALANGGTVYKPRVAKAIVSPRGKLIKRIKAPVRDHIPVSQTVVDYIRSAMYGVVGEKTGTANSLYQGSHFPLGKVLVGGKTGTAELPNTQEDGSWFASFAGPAGGKPQYVTVIEVNKGDQGAKTAAPTSLKVWDALYGLQGQKAIFANGVPPTKLPKLGIAAAKAAALRHSHPRSHGATATTPPSSPPASPGSQAAGLPPALVTRSDHGRPRTLS
jgi:penicillin-binding protein 2